MLRVHECCVPCAFSQGACLCVRLRASTSTRSICVRRAVLCVLVSVCVSVNLPASEPVSEGPMFSRWPCPVTCVPAVGTQAPLAPSGSASLLSASPDAVSQSSCWTLRPGPAGHHRGRRQHYPLGPATALGASPCTVGAEEKEGNSPLLVPPGVWGHQARPRGHCHLILTAIELSVPMD